MHRLLLPFVWSLLILLVANPVVRTLRALVARIVRRREGEFALEGRVWAASLLLMFDSESLRGLCFSLCGTPYQYVVFASVAFLGYF